MSAFPPPPPKQGFSNYPRPELGQNGNSLYWRRPGFYVDAIADAWKIAMSDIWLWIAVMLLFLVIAVVVTVPLTLVATYLKFGGLAPTQNVSTIGLIASIPFSCLGSAFITVVAAGLYIIGMKSSRGIEVSVGDLFAGFSRFGQLLLLGIITALPWDIISGLLSLGQRGANIEFGPLQIFALILVLPTLYLVALLLPSTLLIFDKGMGALESIAESQRVLGFRCLLFGLITVVAAVVSGLGAFACGIGVLFTAPILYITVALHYRYWFEKPPLTEYAPAPM